MQARTRRDARHAATRTREHAHANAHTRTRERQQGPRYAIATPSLRSANTQQHTKWTAWPLKPGTGIMSQKVACSAKKLRNVFVISKKSTTFAAMNTELYIITGRNRLTGQRDEISGAMPLEMAEERLERELQSRKYQRYQAYTHLRVEHVKPIQLQIKFES